MKNFLSIVLWVCCVQLAIGQNEFPEEFLEEFPEKWKFLTPTTKTDHLPRRFFLIEKATLREHSSTFEVVQRLDSHYYIVQQKPGLSSAQSVKEPLHWAVNDQWKIAETLKKAKRNKRDTYLLRSACDPNPQHSSTLKAQSVQGLSGVYQVEGKLEEVLKQYLSNECVTYIGKESLNPTTDASVVDLNLTFNQITTAQAHYPEIDGRGIMISVKENQYNVEDIDLLGKDIPSGIASESVDDHATDMATILAGSGNSSVKGSGVAPAATLSSSDFFDIVPDSDEEYSQLNVHLQNHSYGTVPENFYGLLAEAYDVSSQRNPDILHVFSAGNVGGTTTTEGPYQGIASRANLTGNFKHAKNTLIIGSVDTIGNVFSISSRGPAYDGRIKPELVTYSMFGTSNSAAMVTGVGALLQQTYQENYAGVPSSALLKAVLINSATDVDAPGIDFNTGYGALNADRAIKTLLDGQFATGEVAEDMTVAFNLDIPANATNLKVTLVWTDRAATPGATVALVNDLDMTLSGNGETWLPWVLDSSRDGLSRPAQRGADHLNNIEQITIENPTAGSYEIQVSGFDVSPMSQPFALAYQYDLGETFAWSYPLGGDNLPYDGEAAPYLQWESTYEAGVVGDFEYTIDDGITWRQIAIDVPLEKGFLRWDSYPRSIQLCKVRMITPQTTYTSEEFTISSFKRVRLGLDCADSLLFTWSRDRLANSYDIFTIEGDGLSLISNTTDTSLVIKKNELPTNYFSVQPILANNQKSLRSETLDYQFQGASCYFNAIFPISFPEEDRIVITTNIGSTFGIERMIIERKNTGDFESIGTVIPRSLEFQFEDANPHQGINIYRAVAVLDDGRQIVSDESEIYFLTTLDVQVFPNPVERPESFSVFTRDLNGLSPKIVIYNFNGQLVKEETIIGDRYSVSTAQLNKGIYLYRIS